MKPPVVDDQSEFVEVIQKRSSPTSSSSSSLDKVMNEEEMKKISPVQVAAAPPPMEPVLLIDEHQPNKSKNKNEEKVKKTKKKKKQSSPPKPVIAARTSKNNMNNTNPMVVAEAAAPPVVEEEEEKKKDGEKSNGGGPSAAATSSGRGEKEEDSAAAADEVLEEGLEAMWVEEEVVSATPVAQQQESAPAAVGPSSSPPPARPLSSSSNNNNKHTGRGLRKSFFGSKKKREQEAAAAAAASPAKKAKDSIQKSTTTTTKVQTSVRLLENNNNNREPEMSLPAEHDVVKTSTPSAAAAAAAVKEKGPVGATPVPGGGHHKRAHSSLTMTDGTIETSLLKEAALKAFTARKLLAQALSADGPHHVGGSGGGGSREALAQSAFREASDARKMVEGGGGDDDNNNNKLPDDLDIVLKDATDKGAEAVAMVQKIRAAAEKDKSTSRGKRGGRGDKKKVITTGGDNDKVLPARSMEEHADRARHYLDLILPDAPGMTQAQARTAAAKGANGGDEVSSLGFDNTFSEDGSKQGGAGAAGQQNLLSMSSLNEILDGPVEEEEDDNDHVSPLKTTTTATPGDKKKQEHSSPVVLSDISDVSSSKKKKKKGQAPPADENVDKKDPTSDNDADKEPVAADDDKKKGSSHVDKKKERKSATLKKSGLFGRLRASARGGQHDQNTESKDTSHAVAKIATAETVDTDKAIKKGQAAGKDANESNKSIERYNATVMIEDGEEEEPPEPELSDVHFRIKDVDDRMLKKLNDAIQADCDESITSFDGVKMHNAPVLEVDAKAKKKKDKAKKRDNAAQREKALASDQPIFKSNRSSGLQQTSFIAAPKGDPFSLAQASWDSLLQNKVVPEEALPDVVERVHSIEEYFPDGDDVDDLEVGGDSSSSSPLQLQLDPPQSNEEQEALRNMPSQSPESTMSGDKYSVDDQPTSSEEQLEQQQPDIPQMSRTMETMEPSGDRYMVLPGCDSFEAFLQSCGSEIDTLCGVSDSKEEGVAQKISSEEFPVVRELSDIVVPPEGTVEPSVDKQGKAEKDTTATKPKDHNHRVKNILSRLSSKKSNESSTSKSIPSSKSSRSKNGQGSRKGILGMFGSRASKKSEQLNDTSDTPDIDRDVEARGDSQKGKELEPQTSDSDSDKQLSLPSKIGIGASSESTDKDLSTVDKYSAASVKMESPPKDQHKETTIAKEVMPEDENGKSDVEAPITQSKSSEPASSKKHIPNKEPNAKSGKSASKKEVKESKRRGTPKKNRHKTPKGEKKQTSTKELRPKMFAFTPKRKKEAKAKKHEEITKEDVKSTKSKSETSKNIPLQNSSNLSSTEAGPPVDESPKVSPEPVAESQALGEQDIPKTNSDTENKEDPLITSIRQQSFRQSQKGRRDPVSVDESDSRRGMDP